VNIKNILSILAGILFAIGYIPYITAILRRRTKPAKASWIIWGTLDTITLAGMIAKHSVNGQILGAVVGVWIVIILALKRGTPGWTNLDKLCLVGAALGIVLWQTFNNPVLAIVTSQIVIFLGSIPTFVSAWQDPSRENKLAWTIYWISCILAVFAIPKWTFQDAGQPINFLLIESIMMFILYVRPKLSVHEQKAGER
jgi:hypothetical protein